MFMLLLELFYVYIYAWEFNNSAMCIMLQYVLHCELCRKKLLMIRRFLFNTLIYMINIFNVTVFLFYLFFFCLLLLLFLFYVYILSLTCVGIDFF